MLKTSFSGRDGNSGRRQVAGQGEADAEGRTGDDLHSEGHGNHRV